MIKKISLGVIALYFILMIPDCESTIKTDHDSTAFIWDRDAFWTSLESDFNDAILMDSDSLNTIILTLKADVLNSFNRITKLNNQSLTEIDEAMFELYLTKLFKITPYLAASSQHFDWFTLHIIAARQQIKEYAKLWGDEERNIKYKLLYGLRAAFEGVALIRNAQQFEPFLDQKAALSQAPSTMLYGIKVHSGDLLVSRGTVEVSAFISRGNDLPGNFSHVALIHIDSNSNTASLIEAHIEKGVAISNVDQYMADKKFRFMVLRLEPDHPRLIENPMIAHQAAEYMMNHAQKDNISYDFKMNYQNSNAMFCSEVASFAYQKFGINLWENVSTITQSGTRSWLHDFGVEYFNTQMPSDLEYDPKLDIIGEWIDAETLFEDHLYNAVMDVLLEEANEGRSLTYSSFELPLARVLKAYCWILNQFGEIGMIPEGMSATQALKNNTLVELHQTRRKMVQQKVNDFIEEKGYQPPYWELVNMARHY